MSVRDEMLLRLEAEKGKFISGQELADELGVSRNAVWKAAGSLRSEGYDIKTGSGGYILSEKNDRLIKKKIEELLIRKDRDVIILKSVDSTNNECKRLLTQKENDFSVIAEEQTEGRGRNGRDFYSPADGGLYLSVAMRRNLPLSAALYLTTYCAVCVVEEIERLTGLLCGIKWVNDIFFNGLKVGGILTEAVTDVETGNISDIITGIGIDLHPSNMPEELSQIVGALDCRPIKNELAAALINRIYDFDGNDISHMPRYRKYSIVIGKKITYIKDGKKHQATAEYINDSGELVVKTGTKTEILNSGEVSVKL